MRKHQKITEPEFLSIIREEYQEAKRKLNPLLSGWHFSGVRFNWRRMKSNGGWCYYGEHRIEMNCKYRDDGKGDWDIENFRMCLRHEFCHLAGAHNHGGRFLSFLKLLSGQRWVGSPVYEGKAPKEKIIKSV